MTKEFGQMPDGRPVDMVRLCNDRLDVHILTYGASLQSVLLDGSPMLLGSDTLSDYLGPLRYFGALVGRVANRIDSAKAKIAGQDHTFDANEPNGNCLHGGSDGSGHLLWNVTEESESHVVLALTMPDGHMGFPGTLDVQARYEITGATLRLEISAHSDRETLCNFASHGYWNLSNETTINDHHLQIAAPSYLPVNDAMIPLGKPKRVAGTDFDFTEARKINASELDHNFCLSAQKTQLRPVLWLRSEASGTQLEVATTEAGVQIYDGRTIVGAPRSGLAIEPQAWPDAVNQEDYPSILLAPGETYSAVSEFRFSKF